MRKVGEEGQRDEGGGTERREERVECAAGSVAGASNYSAINNPRVTRVIGPLSLRPRRSPVRLPSFLATPEGINARGTSTRLSLCVGGIYRFAERV